jgi:nitrous oxidase accessory protein
MYSDDNVFEDNVFEKGDAGAALMYSRRLTFRRNQFLRNRGFASVGLLLKTCDDVLAEHNLIADNARGIFLEGSIRVLLKENVIAGSDVGLVLFDSATETRVVGNSFVGNLTPLALSGRRTDTLFEGNYWSGNDAPDLDGDGRSDQPYRVAGVFDHLRGNLTAADLMSRSLAADAVAAAERAMPVLDPVPVLDRAPLARPPDLPVPRPAADAVRERGLVGLLLSAAAFGAALALSVLRRRPRVPHTRKAVA